MPQQCRVGDTGEGTCTLHRDPVSIIATILTGTSTVDSAGIANATLASTGIASCGHPIVLTTCSSTVFHEGQGAVRVGDMGTTGGGSFVMTVGSGDVEVG